MLRAADLLLLALCSKRTGVRVFPKIPKHSATLTKWQQYSEGGLDQTPMSCQAFVILQFLQFAKWPNAVAYSIIQTKSNNIKLLSLSEWNRLKNLKMKEIGIGLSQWSNHLCAIQKLKLLYSNVWPVQIIIGQNMRFFFFGWLWLIHSFLPPKLFLNN